MASDSAELSILITDNAEIAELNKNFRQKEGPTDVLSFPASEDYEANKLGMLGDVIISAEKAEAQKEEFSNSFGEEILRLGVHGTLHLLGYDHENVPDEVAKDMEKLEEKYALLKL